MPPLAEKIVDTGTPYSPPTWVMEGWDPQATPVVEKIYEDFSEEHGTSYEF